MYFAYKTSEADEQFYTLDNAFAYAKRESKQSGCTIIIRDGAGLGSSIRAIVKDGKFRKLERCEPCKGVGRNTFGSCWVCTGDGVVPGSEMTEG